ncbi:transposase [Wolbachia endosymbiont of Pentalonia nigronervosa]
MLPKDFPPWKTVYDHYFRCRNNGKLQRIHDSMARLRKS